MSEWAKVIIAAVYGGSFVSGSGASAESTMLSFFLG